MTGGIFCICITGSPPLWQKKIMKLSEQIIENGADIYYNCQGELLQTSGSGGGIITMWDMIFGLIGGLGLFLIGIQMLASGMQKAAGDRLRRILEALTSRPWIAVFTGILVTFLVQSSSTTSVMVVGFVNAGIMTLSQAVGVIIGSNVGTTLTAQIISFKIDFLALPAIGIGAFVNFFGKRRLYKYLGQAVLGFGLLFLGLITMSAAMNPLKDMEFFHQLIISFSQNPLLGVLCAALFTAMLQSSSASTAVIISMTIQELLTFETAVPLILGTNLGTCITVLFASIGANLPARRAAAAHIFFNLIGIVIALLLLTPFTALITETSSAIPRQVANAHTLFNIFNTLLALLLFKPFIALINTIVPGEEKTIKTGPMHLDRRMLKTPEAAITGVRQEIIRMAVISREMVSEAVETFIKGDKKKIPHVDQMEDLLDSLEKEVTSYMADLSQHSLTHHQSQHISALMMLANDLERIGDHAENILRLTQVVLEDKLPFTQVACKDVKELYLKVDKMLENAIEAFEKEDRILARKVIRSDDEVDDMEKELRQQHIMRINSKQCVPFSGVIFLDILSNLERIADHAVNLAEVITGDD